MYNKTHILRVIDVNKDVIPTRDIALVRVRVCLRIVMTSEPLCEIAAFNVHFKRVH